MKSSTVCCKGLDLSLSFGKITRINPLAHSGGKSARKLFAIKSADVIAHICCNQTIDGQEKESARGLHGGDVKRICQEGDVRKKTSGRRRQET